MIYFRLSQIFFTQKDYDKSLNYSLIAHSVKDLLNPASSKL